MAEDRYHHTLDGQAVDEEDINGISDLAGLADDRVLAELLRQAPQTSGVPKLILRYVRNQNLQATAMVSPSGADGSVVLQPFRALIGSRQSVAQSIAATGDAKAAWRDMRSAVYAPSDNGTSFGHKVQFAANPSGNPRWDQIYVAMTVDAASATTNLRLVKPPTGGAAVPTSTSASVQVQLAIGVAQGTAAVTPSLPAIPSDDTVNGIYYIPLAAVLLPSGFTTSSTVTSGHIQTNAPMASIAASMGAPTLSPASAITVVGPNSVVDVATWGSSGTRPEMAVPPTMAGGKSIFVPVMPDGSPYGDGNIVDASIDWRKRVFRVTAFAGATFEGVGAFPWKPGATSGTCPMAGLNFSSSTPHLLVQMGQSFVDDATSSLGSVTNAGVVFHGDVAQWPLMTTSGIGLYVDLTTGALRLWCPAGTTRRVFFWVDATAQFENV